MMIMDTTIHSKLWFGSWFVAGGWRGSGEAAAEHADGAVQQAGAAGLQRVPGSPAQVRADSAADHRRGECCTVASHGGTEEFDP